MRDLITVLEAKNKPEELELVKTSYSLGGLTPVLSLHNLTQHNKLAQCYVDRFNKNEGDKDFNYSGYFLHNLLFSQYRQPRNNNLPNGPVGNLIRSKFKDWEIFKEEFTEVALTIQGSGWVYLSRDGSIKTIPNHQVKPDILVIVDMWEHSFQPDYGTNKKKYLENIWKIIDWNVINMRWGSIYK
jgi:Fe-Mn family superoxide dismutase